MRELVGEHPLELRGRRGGEQPLAERDRRPARAPARRERPRVSVSKQIEPRLGHAGHSREPCDRRVQRRRLSDGKLAGADDPKHNPVRPPVGRRGDE